MDKHKETFAALPHVNEIWVTLDGNHHLHPDNGGEKVSRSENITIEKQVLSVDDKKPARAYIKK